MSERNSHQIRDLFVSHSPGEWGVEPKGDTSDVFVLRSTNFTGDGHIDYSNVVVRNITHSKLSQCILNSGDILLEKSGGGPDQAVGRVAFFENPTKNLFVCANFIERMQVAEEFEPKFVLFKLLQCYYDGLTVRYEQQTTGIRNLKLDDFLDELIETPRKSEQRKIARILTTLDNLIENSKALISKFQSIKHGMMHDLFARGLDPQGNLRPPQTDAPELYRQSELGWIPKEWEVEYLGNVIGPIVSGWSPNCDAVPADQDQWGILKTTAVVWDGYNESENKRLPEGLQPLPNLEVSVDDILITRKGPMERVGVVVHVPKTRHKLMIPDTVLRLRMLPSSGILPAFVPLSLGSEVVQRDWFGRKIGLADAQVDINHRILKGTAFLKPKQNEQIRIIERHRSFMATLFSFNSELQKYFRLRLGLMQDLLGRKERMTTTDLKEAQSHG